MKAPHKITVTLQNGEAVDVRKPSNRELLAFHKYVLEQRRARGIKSTLPVTVNAPVQYSDDEVVHIAWLISRVTGKSVEWLNSLPSSDVFGLIAALNSFFLKDKQLLDSLTVGKATKLQS